MPRRIAVRTKVGIFVFSLGVRMALVVELLVGALVLLGAVSRPVVASTDDATTINVTTEADTQDAAGGDCAAMTVNNITTTGDGLVSLREAICAANNHTEDINIVLATGIYSITLTGVEDANLTGDFDIHANGGDVTITGEGAQFTVIAGLGDVTGTDRVFHVDPTAAGGMTVTFSGLTISNGYAINFGGGILNHGSTVNLIDSVVTGNKTDVQANEGCGGGIFNTTNGTVNLTGSSIIGNRAFTTDTKVFGGGICNHGTLNIDSSDFQDNWVTVTGSGYLAEGGGVYHDSGTLKVHESSFIGNHATQGGGLYILDSNPVEVFSSTLEDNGAHMCGFGIGGGMYIRNTQVTVTLSTLEDNYTDGNGGGIFISESTVTIEDSDLVENEALDFGGGIYNSNGMLTVRDQSELRDNTANTGGAIYNRSDQLVTIEDSYFNYNDSIADGGGIWNDGGEMLIKGSNFYTNKADASCGAIGNNLGAVMALMDNTIRASESGDGGGAICNLDSELVISDTVITENTTTGDGAGIYAEDGILYIYSSTITYNTNSNGYGGGIYRSGGSTHIYDSTLSDNHADYSGGGIYNEYGVFYFQRNAVIDNTSEDLLSQNRGGIPSDGGGIYNTGGTVYVANSTVSGNEATFNGGGVYCEKGSVYLQNVTITDNYADNDMNTYGDGGGIFCYPDGAVYVKNSILFNNFDKSGGGHDCRGTILIYGDNLIHNTIFCTLGGTGRNRPNIDPLLGPLAYNGGPTKNQALLEGSPAIDAASDCTNLFSGLVTEDQRGVKRPWGTACDIGAYEAKPSLLLNKIVSPQMDVDYHGTVTYTLTISNAGVAVAMDVRLTDTLPSEVDFGDWITQPCGATVDDDVVTWSGTIAGRTEIELIFTAIHVGDYGEQVENWVYMGHAGEQDQEPAYFEVEEKPWWYLYLPVVERGE
jgi:uncharacterized repeat protein (TIGR01451 family)